MKKTDAYEIEVKGLDQLLKALKAKPPIARIGILGGKNIRAKGAPEISYKSLMRRQTVKKGAKLAATPTNAEIGAAHEFGAPARGLPARSFLRMPLTNFLNKELESSGALSKNETKEVLKAGTVMPWLKKVAIVAEGVVRGAFDSAGYGEWPGWRTKGYSNNANQILVDTTQLRDSITSEVKEQ